MLSKFSDQHLGFGADGFDAADSTRGFDGHYGRLVDDDPSPGTYTRVFAVRGPWRYSWSLRRPEETETHPSLLTAVVPTGRTLEAVKRPASTPLEPQTRTAPSAEPCATNVPGVASAGHANRKSTRGREHPAALLDCLLWQEFQIAQDLRSRIKANPEAPVSVAKAVVVSPGRPVLSCVSAVQSNPTDFSAK